MTTQLRQPQQQRSRATRQRLLEAAVDSLCQIGWQATTVAVVAERAGVSRGATQHHFPTREDLFAAAVEYMAEVRVAEIRGQVSGLPFGAGRTVAVVGQLVTFYTGPLFRAALQVWAAAAADPALRESLVPLEAKLAREAHRVAVELLGVDETVPGMHETVQATLDLARGLGLANVLTDDSKRRDAIVAQWAAVLDAIMQTQPAG
jgi:AcrR family transcriptional regulator